MPTLNESDMMNVLEPLANTTPSDKSTARAMGRAREAIRKNETHRSMRWRIVHQRLPRVAAGIILLAAITTAILLAPNRSVSAATLLEEVRQAAAGYQGWIRFRAVSNDAPSGVFDQTVYYHTGDRTLGIISITPEGRDVQFCSWAENTRWEYKSRTNELTASRFDLLARETVSRSIGWLGAGDPVSEVVDWLVQTDREVTVTKKREGDTYRLELRSDQLANGETTWLLQSEFIVDVATRRLRSVRYLQNETSWINCTIEYDAPAITSIFDLNVPEDHVLVDRRGAEFVDTDGTLNLPEPTSMPVKYATVRELRDLVAETRARIHNLRVGWRTRHMAWEDTLADTVATISGSRVRFEHHNRLRPADRVLDEPSHVVTFDGEQSGTWNGAPSNVLLMQNGRALQTYLSVQPWFEFMIWTERSGGSMTLEDLLRQSSVVRPTLERVGDRLCHVVDLSMQTIWLDAERGGLPLRCVRRDVDPSVLTMEWFVEEVVEVDGFWFIARAKKRVPPMPDNNFEKFHNEWISTIEVLRNESGKAMIEVNIDLPDSTFRIWETVPEGTRVHRMDEGG